MATKKSTKQGLIAAERGALMFQGISVLMFGIAASFWPGLTTLTLVYILAAFLLVDGAISFFGGVANLGRSARSNWMLILGVLEVLAAVLLFHQPNLALATVLWLLALILVVRSLFSFIHSFLEHALATTRVLHAIIGVLGLIVGLIILEQPLTGGVAFVWVLGIYALINGPILIAIAADLGRKS